MGHAATFLLIAGVSIGRFAVLMLIAVAAVPLLAAAPAELPGPMLNPPADHNRATDTGFHGDRDAYPTELPRVPVNDALQPPRLLWNPTPTSLVKVVPSKVRYKLKF